MSASRIMTNTHYDCDYDYDKQQTMIVTMIITNTHNECV